MAQKHLHELLKEDQEPFLLKNFIADRKNLLLKKNSPPKSHLLLKKQKPISESSIFAGNFCKKACFFPSPDPNKSPLFQFQSPCKNKNAVFLNIPSTTAALLLEAALRIQKKSSSSKSRNGFGLFGSLLKRLNHKNQSQREETVSRNGFFRKSYSATKMVVDDSKSESDRFCSETSMEFQTCCSSPHSQNSEENRFSSSPESIETGFVDSDFSLCESPFRFVLQPGSSPDLRPPEFSPTTSPTRHEDVDKKNHSVESLNNLEAVAEEDKEQSSPVSVLDPPFQDDNDIEDEENEEDKEDEDDNFEENISDYEKAKQQLLNKLRRFEKLAGLDAIELEKRMEEEEGEDDDLEEKEEETGLQSHLLNSKLLVSKMVKRVSWRKSKTIEIMVKEDFKTEIEESMTNQEVVGEAVADIELEIYSVLMEEFAGELVLVAGANGE